MVCTWGDTNDIRRFMQFQLDNRQSLDNQGKLTGIAGKYQGLNIEEARKRAELIAICTALRMSAQNISKAAEILRISRRTLYRLMEKHDIDGESAICPSTEIPQLHPLPTTDSSH